MPHIVSLSTLYPNAVNPRFGTFVARSLEALADSPDWDVTVVNPIGIPPIAFGKYRALTRLPSQEQTGGLTVHHPRFTLVPKVGGRRNPSAIARAVLPLLRRLHAAQPIDLLDAQFFYPDGPAAAWLAQQLKLPLSIKARGSDIAYWGGLDYAREQMLEAAECATGLLSVSQDLSNQMVQLGMRGSKIRVHYTGLDRDRFRPLDHVGLRGQLSQTIGFPLDNTHPLLVSVGALIERKGQDLVIGALPAIPGARLILVGKGEDEEHLRQLARDLDVSERVHFAGSIDHDLLPVILSAADAMVLPTVSEGLANAWVEALACGTPVVTTDVGGVRELITSDIAGRIIERTPECIVNAVKSILADKPNRQDVAALVERFSWQANASELADHYSRLIKIAR
jgi:glycosyltransferase involved in cell wall biosynthesis